MLQKIIFSIFACLLMNQAGIAQNKSAKASNKHIFKVTGENIYAGKWILKDKAQKGIRCLSCYEGWVYVAGKGVRVTRMVIGQDLDGPRTGCGVRRRTFHYITGQKFLTTESYRDGGTIRILEAINIKTGKKMIVRNKDINIRMK